MLRGEGLSKQTMEMSRRSHLHLGSMGAVPALKAFVHHGFDSSRVGSGGLPPDGGAFHLEIAFSFRRTLLELRSESSQAKTLFSNSECKYNIPQVRS